MSYKINPYDLTLRARDTRWDSHIFKIKRKCIIVIYISGEYFLTRKTRGVGYRDLLRLF